MARPEPVRKLPFCVRISLVRLQGPLAIQWDGWRGVPYRHSRAPGYEFEMGETPKVHHVGIVIDSTL